MLVGFGCRVSEEQRCGVSGVQVRSSGHTEFQVGGRAHKGGYGSISGFLRLQGAVAGPYIPRSIAREGHSCRCPKYQNYA